MKIFNLFRRRSIPPTASENKKQVMEYLSYQIYLSIDKSTLRGEEIATRLGMAKQDLNSRLIGHTSITIDFLISLAYVLGKTVKIDMIPLNEKLEVKLQD